MTEVLQQAHVPLRTPIFRAVSRLYIALDAVEESDV